MKLLLSEIVDDIGSRSTVADMCTAINEWRCEAPHFKAYVDLVLEGGLPGWYEYQYSTNATPLRDDRFITHSYDVLIKFLPQLRRMTKRVGYSLASRLLDECARSDVPMLVGALRGIALAKDSRFDNKLLEEAVSKKPADQHLL